MSQALVNPLFVLEWILFFAPPFYSQLCPQESHVAVGLALAATQKGA